MATAHIDLNNLTHNLSRARAFIKPETQLLAALKANAYGHGAVEVAKHLERLGVNWFGVATVSEALELRQAGLNANILLLSPVYENLSELIELDIALPGLSDYSLDCLEKAVATKPARVHLKVDTGMGRLGLGPQASLALARRIDSSKKLELEAVWTHFADAEEENRSFTECQIEAFQLFLELIAKAKILPKLRHASNTAAIFAYPEAHFDMVRLGIGLYGYAPSSFITRLEADLKPAMSLSAPISFVKRVKAGSSISYNSLWHAPKDTTIATLRIGYADGYPRMLTGKAEVLVQNQLRPVVGRICMDQMMVDVGDLEVCVGDRVSLLDTKRLTAEALAAPLGTNSYEILTSVAARVKREYH